MLYHFGIIFESLNGLLFGFEISGKLL